MYPTTMKLQEVLFRTLSASQPQSVSDDRGFSQIARLSETSDTPTTSRRRHSKSTKSASTLEDFALMGSLGSVGTSRSPLSIQKYKNYTNMPSTSNPACMSTITGRYGNFNAIEVARYECCTVLLKSASCLYV